MVGEGYASEASGRSEKTSWNAGTNKMWWTDSSRTVDSAQSGRSISSCLSSKLAISYNECEDWWITRRDRDQWSYERHKPSSLAYVVRLRQCSTLYYTRVVRVLADHNARSWLVDSVDTHAIGAASTADQGKVGISRENQR